MAGEKKTQQINLEDESKKDTVRINLPPGLTGKAAAPAPGGPPTVKLKPAGPGGEDEAKKETAVMGKPAETPKPKSDTSRVQVSGTKPAVPETPRPTVKLKQLDAPAAPRPAAPTPPPIAVGAGAGVMAEPSGALAGLSLAAMVLAVLTAVYLAMLAFG